MPGTSLILPNDIPAGSVLGLNYSGMHDSAVAIVAPDGTPVFAAALERFSRVKQDGRPPFALLDDLPWERISKVAVSTEQSFQWPQQCGSKLLQIELPEVRRDGLRHGDEFYNFLRELPCDKEFVCHQMAHAASAFWGSGFQESLCLTYDGGMFNSPWFGGLYSADMKQGIRVLDQFSALHYAKVTSLYTFVTALLGFTPNKHEGKITGLAAYGNPTDECRALLKHWFAERFLEIESAMEWVFAYDHQQSPMLLVNEALIEPFRESASRFSREELASTVQEFAELHVIDLLGRASALGWASDNICLAGGLFANVKINQRVAEAGFKKIFVAPPMTDDGTALGAAWHVLSSQPDFSPQILKTICLGPEYPHDAEERMLADEGIRFSKPTNPENTVAELLAAGAVVAVFKGHMEYGPRALGNRSILAQATKSDINQSLNQRLNRTEFMPFAPMSRVEDAPECYLEIDRVAHAAEFMTVTVNCTEAMIEACPAVVHIDRTARPQLVSAEGNPFIHGVLTRYKALTNKPALVNTSFNIHEEPIVCSPQDALHGFFESGLDWLYFGSGCLISFDENKDVALKYAQNKLRKPSQKSGALTAVIAHLFSRMIDKDLQLVEKQAVIEDIERGRKALEESLVEINTTRRSDDVENLLSQYEKTIRAYRIAYGSLPYWGGIPGLKLLVKSVRRAKEFIRPRIGNLNQYPPRPLPVVGEQNRVLVSDYPRICIVTPSFAQGGFIERTIRSVTSQEYPNLDYFIQDAGSQDGTLAVLKKYTDLISGWSSEKDGGQSQAINRGFSKTSGEIMAWLNSDDLLLPNALVTVADYFNSHPDVDVVYGNRLLIDENDMEIGRWIMPGHDNEVLSWADFVPQETLFWRRSIWEKAGGQIDETFRFAMDWDLLARFRDAGAKFGHIPRFLGAFRIHEHQKTSAVIGEVGYAEMDRIRERLLGRIPCRAELRKAVAPFLFRHVMVDLGWRIKHRIGKLF